MKYNPKKHNRKSIRLKGYDYSQAGLYFVTIVCQDRTHLFGKIQDQEMHLNEAGEMVNFWYDKLEDKFPNVHCQEMIVMPNHFHCIIELTGKEKIPLSQVIQWFKTMTTNAYIRGVKNSGWQAFNNRVWQRNYYEHIIRNERAYHQISTYIRNNPAKWGTDKFGRS